MLALPGGAYVYQGEELGLPEHTTMPDEHRQDPTFHRTGGTVVGRDGCRVPMPWVRDAPSLGFGPGDSPWLPQPEAYADLAVDQQDGVEGSTLELYRALLGYRHKHRFGHGSLTWDALSSECVVALRNTSGDGERTLLVVTNLGAEPVPVPEGDVLISSGPLTDDGAVPTVPTDTTAWVRLPAV
jgi:alpha-glucosidase